MHDNEDCAVCLQPCLYTIQLPCSHQFCFLCAKGFAMKSGVCALCRQPIPNNFIKDPTNYVKSSIQISNEDQPKHEWFYSGKSGWWQYDSRTSTELEKAHTLKLHEVQLLIAGSIYTINLDNMTQYQTDGSSRHRNVKRQLVSSDATNLAGIAGIPIHNIPDGSNGPKPSPVQNTASSTSSPSSNTS